MVFKSLQVSFQLSADAAIPESAQGMGASVRGYWQHDVDAGRNAGGELMEQAGIYKRGVTRKDEPPFGSGLFQRGGDCCEWTESGIGIRADRIPLELRNRPAKEDDIFAERRENGCEMLEQGPLVPLEKRLVSPHPGALSTNGYEAEIHGNRMVALDLQGALLGNRGITVRVKSNNLLRICLTLALMATIAQNVVWAADGSSEGSAARVVATKPRVYTVVVDTDTGKLVRVRQGSVPKAKTPAATRKAIAAAKEIAKQTPAVEAHEIKELIDSTAKRHGVDVNLVHSVIRAESNYQQKAISPKGALGLMQLVPETASRFGVDNPFDASQNLDGGVRYLKFLTERFQGNLRLALAAYNAGEGAVARHGGVPPYRETQDYVTKITRRLGMTQADNAGQSDEARLTNPELDSGSVAGLTDAAGGRINGAAASREAAVRMYTDSQGRLHLETIP